LPEPYTRSVTQSRILEIEGEYSHTFDCGDLPAGAAVSATGHEPNGYFWEGVATLLAPGLVQQLQSDSEAGMFSATGRRSELERLQTLARTPPRESRRGWTRNRKPSPKDSSSTTDRSHAHAGDGAVDCVGHSYFRETPTPCCRPVSEGWWPAHHRSGVRVPEPHPRPGR
jgi:hypothetical protein